jgi:CDP-diacylglycerol--serine O-phosphatidyltransferase
LKKHIPNFVTLLNVLCGSIAVLFVVNGNMLATAFFVFLGIFFDFFDGLLARKLKVQSNLGLQLDSLADMITSGLVPGLVMFHLLSLTVSDFSLQTEAHQWSDSIFGDVQLLPFVGLVIVIASAYRLATFNVSTNQSVSFIGLPTPANALLILSFPLILEYQHNDLMNSIILNPWFLVGITLISSYLLNAKIKLIALKFKTLNFRDNAARYLLIILAIILLIIFKFAGIPLIILLYILMSLASK